MDVLTESTGALPPILNDRILPRSRSGITRRRTLNHRVRFAAKQYSEQHPGGLPCETNGLTCGYQDKRARADRQNHTRARQHAEYDIKFNRHQNLRSEAPVRSARGGRPVINDADEVALARSNAHLPGDRQPSLQRTPSLEREDAFCDDKTYKGKVHTRQMPMTPMDNDDAQVAELYRMGLLYDEADKPRTDTSAFNLNDIRHDEPVYSIRPARRSRKAKTTAIFDPTLPLDLSFADLGQDNDLAQFFTTTPTSSQEDIPPRPESAPLRVIYELSTKSPSFDMDTSQPPDLMDDEEYDCFSDFELDDDSPSQREIYTPNEASGPWVLLGDDS